MHGAPARRSASVRRDSQKHLQISSSRSPTGVVGLVQAVGGAKFPVNVPGRVHPLRRARRRRPTAPLVADPPRCFAAPAARSAYEARLEQGDGFAA